MKSTLLLLGSLFIALQSLKAQSIDQVSMQNGYSEMSFYRLSDGFVSSMALSDWDLAFSNFSRAGAGIMINEGASLQGSPLKLFSTSGIEWSDPITNTEQFTEDRQLFNPDLSWAEGAFNSLADSTNGLDFGWGMYDPQSHKVIGNRVFVLQMRDQSFRKILIEELTSGTYHFKIAQLDGSAEQSYEVSKDASKAPILFFSLESGQLMNIPVDYDLIFTRYSSSIDDGAGNMIPYTVSGVLQAPGVKVAKATGINPFKVEESDFAEAYQEAINSIGYDWKSYDFTLGWILPDDLAYFVETAQGEKYKLVFLDFEGAQTGISTIERTPIGTAHQRDEKLETSLRLYPNPASDWVYLEGIDTNTELEWIWRNTSGQSVHRFYGNAQDGCRVPGYLPKGAYILQIRSGRRQFSQIIQLK
jgi:hypothetical protein